MSKPDSRVLLDKKYSSDALCYLFRETHEALDERFTPAAAGIPKDAHGFHTGHFHVTIKWVPEEV